MPAFELTDRTGEAFASSSLGGSVWVAGFIFTRCPDVCPAVSAEMRWLRDGMAEDGTAASLVSFSVDPRHDTPERLATYADRWAAGDEWRFLTGEREDIARLLKDGFLLAFADDGPVDNPITHSDRLVLVDGEMQVRGYYRGRDRDDVKRLRVDAARLAGATPRS